MCALSHTCILSHTHITTSTVTPEGLAGSFPLHFFFPPAKCRHIQGVCILFLYACFFPLLYCSCRSDCHLYIDTDDFHVHISSSVRIHSPLEDPIETVTYGGSLNLSFPPPRNELLPFNLMVYVNNTNFIPVTQVRILAFVIHHFAPVVWPPHSFSNMPSILPLQGLCICVLFWRVLSLHDLHSLLCSFLLVSSNVTVKCCLYSLS